MSDKAPRYDQGVMSQVNLNPDYQTHMGINPVEGTLQHWSDIGEVDSG